MIVGESEQELFQIKQTKNTWKNLFDKKNLY
jgi:hypothetical protein